MKIASSVKNSPNPTRTNFTSISKRIIQRTSGGNVCPGENRLKIRKKKDLKVSKTNKRMKTNN